MSAPRCAAQDCGVELVARPGWTPEQRWCGRWWEHPPAPGGYMAGCTVTVLERSPALLAHLAEQEAAARQDTLPLDA